jgi:hypothetical protein
MMKQLLVARFIKGNDRKEAAERKEFWPMKTCPWMLVF